MLTAGVLNINVHRHSQRHHQQRLRVPNYAFSKQMERRIEFYNSQREKLIGTLLSSHLPKTILLCHGYSDHKDTRLLKSLADQLYKNSISSFRFDFSGNGESEGEFEFGNYSKEVEDIRSAIEFIRNQEQLEVVAILGHSKGGNDVLLYASKYDDVPLVINLSARYEMKEGIVQRFGEEVLQKLEETGAVEVPRVTADKKVVNYKLTKQSMEERLNTNMKDAVSKIKKSHVLTIHGTDDTVIPVQAAESIDQLIENHELFLIEGANHNFSQDEHLGILVKHVIQYIATNSNTV